MFVEDTDRRVKDFLKEANIEGYAPIREYNTNCIGTISVIKRRSGILYVHFTLDSKEYLCQFDQHYHKDLNEFETFLEESAIIPETKFWVDLEYMLALDFLK